MGIPYDENQWMFPGIGDNPDDSYSSRVRSHPLIFIEHSKNSTRGYNRAHFNFGSERSPKDGGQEELGINAVLLGMA
jgi:hypothetical protein